MDCQHMPLLVTAGVVRVRARALLDVIDTDCDLTSPIDRTKWVRDVQRLAGDLDDALHVGDGLVDERGSTEWIIDEGQEVAP